MGCGGLPLPLGCNAIRRDLEPSTQRELNELLARSIAALREMVKLVRSGGYVGITPDGPRGPRMRASEGVVAAARLTGVPVVPLGISTTRRRLLNSWDRFLLPMPLSRGVFVWGDPIVIDAVRKTIDLGVPRETIDQRLRAWQAPPPKAERGLLAKYARLVSSASAGAVTDLNLG